MGHFKITAEDIIIILCSNGFINLDLSKSGNIISIPAEDFDKNRHVLYPLMEKGFQFQSQIDAGPKAMPNDLSKYPDEFIKSIAESDESYNNIIHHKWKNISG